MSDITFPPWQVAPPSWRLADGEVLVFRLDLSGQPTPEDRSLLSDDERSRADRFRFDRHRDRWVICRSTLRRLLGHATNLPPGRVTFAYTDQGKPHLRESDVRFNVSHSHDLGLIALSGNSDVGVDVEIVRDSPDLPSVAERFFTAAEQSFMTTGPSEARVTRFYQCWTRKEAWMKCLGHGLLKPPEHFDVSRTLGSPVSTLSPAERGFEGPWIVCELRPSHESVAALVAGPATRVVRLYG